MTPTTLRNQNTRENAEFWMQMGKDMGVIAASLKDLTAEFHDFCSTEFKSVCDKQEMLETKLNSSIKTNGIVIGCAMFAWTVANVLLHIFKVL